MLLAFVLKHGLVCAESSLTADITRVCGTPRFRHVCTRLSLGDSYGT
jgi:hypothetical protein